MGTKRFGSLSERALYQRIARKLQADGKLLRTARSQRVEQEIGHYFVVNANNHIVDGFVDLEELGHKLGVIQGWERLEKES